MTTDWLDFHEESHTCDYQVYISARSTSTKHCGLHVYDKILNKYIYKFHMYVLYGLYYFIPCVVDLEFLFPYYNMTIRNVYI